MTLAQILPPTTEVLEDARDGGRAMRVRWHPGEDVCVLSIWREDTCAATFQLTRAQAPGLINCLVQGLAQPPSPWSSTTRAASEPRSRLERIRAARPWRKSRK